MPINSRGRVDKCSQLDALCFALAHTLQSRLGLLASGEMDFKQQVSEVVSTAQFGDLIEFSYPIGYSHWGIYDEDGYIIHFAVADEGELKKRFRQSLQNVFPVCGDLLLGQTQIRRQLLSEVNVPTGAQVMISNNRHARTPSPIAEMRQRRDTLLNKELNYNLFTLNCEHFATFIRYGQAVCNQIPGKSKNTECESATKVFQDIVPEVCL